ncbi:unnamed protein product [Heligmosomoides polygyrus]|uniref:39S ribosomal protein L36, mitochondrial n=1 Tax=Heligmosomoides polygyrus TaxID=6339 RepID=A0A183FED3_HELPZ|nr:unnamed protein product [Heligmosomoides polygyrus]
MSGIIFRLVNGGASVTRFLLGVHNTMKELVLRCGSCYSVHVDERVHVECTEQPRHKARETFNGFSNAVLYPFLSLW